MLKHSLAEPIPFNSEYPFSYGVIETLSPLVRRIIANNPGPFTFRGTATYIVGHDRVAVIDPGPLLETHVDNIVKSLQNEQITHLLVTHTHRDHSPACRMLTEVCDAKTYAYGPHVVAKDADNTPVEEGADTTFEPDVTVRDTDMIVGDGWSIECLHTPGHTSNHMCYHLAEENTLFCGDHIMAWSTSVIAPPDGNMADYLASLKKLLQRNDQRYWPSHGPCIEQTHSFVRAYLQHRQQREMQVLNCLDHDIHSITAMVSAIYTDLKPQLYQAATQSLLATLIYLVQQGKVSCTGTPGLQSNYTLGSSD